MAFMLALVFIFEIVQREIEMLTRPREGIVGARDLENGVSAQDGGESRPGHNVALPPEVTENGRPLDDVYAEVTGKPFFPFMPAGAFNLKWNLLHNEIWRRVCIS